MELFAQYFNLLLFYIDWALCWILNYMDIEERTS